MRRRPTRTAATIGLLVAALLAAVPSIATGAVTHLTDEPLAGNAIDQVVAVQAGPCGDPDLGDQCRPYFADLAKDPQGDADDLLLVYRWSSAHTKKPSQLRMLRSRDGGATWEQATPFVVADSADRLDFRDPSLTPLSSGRLLLSYFVSNGDSGAVLQTQVRYRDQDDAAFSAPVQVFSSTIPRPVTSAKIAELSDGNLLIPLYGTPASGGMQHAVIVASVDGGRTWDGRVTGRQKTIAASSSLHFQEPAVAEIEPGHVRAVLRTGSGSGSGPGYQTDSYNGDYMRTWGSPWSLGVIVHAPEFFRIPGTPHVPYLWSQPDKASSPGNRQTMVAVRRLDLPWPDTPRRVVYDPGSNWDSGYSGTVALGTDTLVTVVYDTAPGTAIVLRHTVP